MNIDERIKFLERHVMGVAPALDLELLGEGIGDVIAEAVERATKSLKDEFAERDARTTQEIALTLSDILGGSG